MIIKRDIDGREVEIQLTDDEMERAFDTICKSEYSKYAMLKLQDQDFDNPFLHLRKKEFVTREFIESIAQEMARQIDRYEVTEDYAYEQALRICMGEYLLQKIDEIRELVPPGTRVKLIHMDDVYAPPDGALGTIKAVDDVCQIHVIWDTGGSLALIPGVDQFEIVREDAE